MNIKFEIPFLPPSVNQCYATNWNTRRRFKTAPYKAFIERMAVSMPSEIKMLLMVNKHVFESAIEIEYNFYFPDNRRRDVGNYEKTLTDTLVNMGFMKDDSLIERIVLEKYIDKGKPATVIRITDQTSR